MNLDGLSPDIRHSLAQELALGQYADEQDVLRHALLALAEQRETIAGVREGLADIEAGRFESLEDYESDFRRRHNMPDSQGK
jgi:predicted transcriptional regulator